MLKTMLLAKTMLKMQYRNPDRKASHTILYIIAFLFLLPILIIYMDVLRSLVYSLYTTFEPMGQESIVLGLLFLSLHFLLFFISIITVLGTFYFAEDMESFIPFPFQPYQLLVSKAVNPFIYLYITTGALYIPFFYFYGNISEASFLFYVYGCISLLFLPIVPFSLAAVLVMFIMRFVNIAKNKDRSKLIAGISSFLFIIGINVFVRINTDNEAMMENTLSFVQEQDGLLMWLTGFYPPAYLNTKVLTEASSWVGILTLLLYVMVCFIAFALFIWLGQLLYLKGALGINTGNKKSVSNKNMSKNLKLKPIWFTYMKKELRIIFRTPTFLMQCVIQSLFGPFFIMIIFMLDFGSTSLFSLSESFTDKQILLILFLATIFSVGANPTSYTSISREGKNWSSNLFLPLHPRQILTSKIAVSTIIDFLTIGILAIIIIYLNVSLEIILLWLFLSITGSWYTSTLGVYLDFIEPKLNWTDEQELFRMRLIGFLSLIFTAGVFGMIGLILWNIHFIQEIYLLAVILILCIGIATGIVQGLLERKQREKHQQYI
ncbi:putative ABC transporter permease subunit [Oceanobacillus senegalensis]|uniref:putative ABC transporter permease subunit n=1 Tax=Oceanobacillus senegalensis TaxID=1936063 RepID=UPI000A3137D1|nr:hypothetical protein [Oceanobacillus senegalensis]